jgi:branched-chain amino acid transport system permease protein
VRAGGFTVGGVSLRYQDLAIVGCAALAGLALWLFLTRAAPGRAMVASAQQPVAARLLGIPQRAMFRLAFGLAGALAGLAGLVISPVYLTSWDSGLTLGLKGFVAASLAGLVSLPGAVAAGILLGVVESLAAGYLDSGLKDAVAYAVLLAVLVIRPEGLRRVRAARV